MKSTFAQAGVWQVHAPAGAERFVKVPGFICIKLTGPGLQSTPGILNGVQTHLKTLNNRLRHLLRLSSTALLPHLA